MLSWTGKRDPGLIAERMTIAENVERWDHLIVPLSTVFLIALLIVARFDSIRLNWSFVPITVLIGGWIGNGFSLGINWWPMATSTFLSQRGHIQDDLDHRVVSTGS